jgi:predicted DNA-binding protein (MmcQ/YjbR family)
MADDRDVPEAVLERLRAICLALPEAHEELAWVGVRWRIGKRTFAHVLMIRDAWPPVYERAFATEGPACVLTFESAGEELAALSAVGPPYHRPPWRPTIVGMVLGGDVDWGEIGELLTDSYRVLAPKRLTRQLDER